MYSTKMGLNVKIIGISVAAFVLLTISMFGGLFFAVWNLHGLSIAQSVSLKDVNQNQMTELQNLKSENANLQNQISELRGFVGANPHPHSSDEATVMDTLKRLTRQSNSSQSATDLLADALAELIEKKLYTIMDCARDDADNLTDCSLKPGPKGGTRDALLHFFDMVRIEMSIRHVIFIVHYNSPSSSEVYIHVLVILL